MIPAKEVRDEWRRQTDSELVIHSSLWEAVPYPEFVALLGAVDELEAWQAAVGDPLLEGVELLPGGAYLRFAGLVPLPVPPEIGCVPDGREWLLGVAGDASSFRLAPGDSLSTVWLVMRLLLRHAPKEPAHDAT